LRSRRRRTGRRMTPAASLRASSQTSDTTGTASASASGRAAGGRRSIVARGPRTRAREASPRWTVRLATSAAARTGQRKIKPAEGRTTPSRHRLPRPRRRRRRRRHPRLRRHRSPPRRRRRRPRPLRRRRHLRHILPTRPRQSRRSRRRHLPSRRRRRLRRLRRRHLRRALCRLSLPRPSRRCLLEQSTCLRPPSSSNSAGVRTRC